MSARVARVARVARARVVVSALLAFLAAPAAFGQCGPGGGSCQETHKGPGCDDVDCCGLICKIMPACCSSDWDSQCASAAGTLCPQSGCPGKGACYEANNSPGCEDKDCCTEVCAADAFCCDVVWDGLCVDGAKALCAPQLPGDLNGDGRVDVSDLVALILEFGPCGPGPCPADVNDDGQVDVSDLVALLLNWTG